MAMTSVIADTISRRWLAAPLCIWGKLPSHGDFLKHGTTAAQAQDWQDWVNRVWRLRHTAPPAQRAKGGAHAEPGWLTLEPRKASIDLADVPVAFVMQPGAMPFSPKHCVQGVIVASEDQFGRACPLIIFQQIAPGWLRRTWTDKSGHNSHHDILYWLARIAARAHAAQRGWHDLAEVVDAVGRAHSPNWRHVLGAPVPAPSGMQLDTLLRKYCDQDDSDTAHGLHGVHRMPWVNWPVQIVRSAHPVPAFWQQDMRGGYINVGESLTQLWGARA
jgi:hypothetical protein